MDSTLAPVESWEFPNQATLPGSESYYTIRFAPAHLRDDFAQLHAWHHQIRRVLSECSDPGVARLKLAWWQEEFVRSQKESSNHSLLQLLKRLIDQHSLPAAPFLDILAASVVEIEGSHLIDHQALTAHCRREQGALAELLLRRSSPNSDAGLISSARAFGEFIGVVEVIRNLGAAVRRPCCRFPSGMLLSRALQQEAQSHLNNDQELPEQLQEIARQAQKKYQKALVELDKVTWLALKPLLARSAMAYSLINVLETDGYPVINQRVIVPPIRLLWIAWRTSQTSLNAFRRWQGL